MKKQQILFYIPLTIVAGLIIYSRAVIFSEDLSVSLRHYIALELLFVLIFLCVINFRQAVVATGFYLLLATFNFLSLSVDINTWSFGIGPVRTPPVNLPALGLLTLFLVLNFDTLLNIHLDYKELKNKNKGK